MEKTRRDEGVLSTKGRQGPHQMSPEVSIVFYARLQMLRGSSVLGTREVKLSRLVAAQRMTGTAASVESRWFASGSSTCQAVSQAVNGI